MSAVTPREIAGGYGRWMDVQQWLFGWLYALIALQTQANEGALQQMRMTQMKATKNKFVAQMER